MRNSLIVCPKAAAASAAPTRTRQTRIPQRRPRGGRRKSHCPAIFPITSGSRCLYDASIAAQRRMRVNTAPEGDFPAKRQMERMIRLVAPARPEYRQKNTPASPAGVGNVTYSRLLCPRIGEMPSKWEEEDPQQGSGRGCAIKKPFVWCK